MAVYAIGDVQGCDQELGDLLKRIQFKADRDRLWFVGDLVNRGPQSLAVLRRVRALDDNAIVVLGNHDLHLLAVARSSKRRLRGGDTLDAVLDAPDRDPLLDWLERRPLFHYDATLDIAMVHAGVVPQWDLAHAQRLAREVELALAKDAEALYEHMYGDKPDRWTDTLNGYSRLRFIVNCMTRLRYCTSEGRIDLKIKGPPSDAPPPFVPWFRVPDRASRAVPIVCGHWSTLGLHLDDNVMAIDTGCVWGGRLCALRLDEREPPVLSDCARHQNPGSD
jgi:bis(5'-nucleosyl)-tetraphosphatase (symmetrical)